MTPLRHVPKRPLSIYHHCAPSIWTGILFQIHAEDSPSSRLLVSDLAIYITAFRTMFPFARNLVGQIWTSAKQFFLRGFWGILWGWTPQDLAPQEAPRKESSMAKTLLSSICESLLRHGLWVRDIQGVQWQIVCEAVKQAISQNLWPQINSNEFIDWNRAQCGLCFCGASREIFKTWH